MARQVSRVGDIGVGYCPKRHHHHYITHFITGSAHQFSDGIPICNKDTIGIATCGCITHFISSSSFVKNVENMEVGVGDIGQTCHGGKYVTITGSTNTTYQE